MASKIREISLIKGAYDRESFRSLLSDFISPDFSDLDSNRIALAMEEAIVNVFEHAYHNRPGGDSSARIDLRLQRMDDRLRIEMQDSGPSFDPTGVPSIDPEKMAEDGSDGGYGIHLMRTIMHIEHQIPEDGGNLLIMEKSFRTGRHDRNSPNEGSVNS